jgi:molybdate transport system substrate-binding protein
MVAIMVAASASCGSTDDRLVVFAASSLTDVFDEIEVDFEAAHPGVDVVTSYGGSSSLVAQLEGGAPADVLATANPEQMSLAVRELAIGDEPVVFARNELVIAVESGNPLGVRSIDDLAGVPIVVLAAPEVPAGAYARQVLDCAGVVVEPASLETSVRSVATKVSLGEADAGLVYRTDIDDRLTAVEIGAECNVSAEYPIVALDDGAIASEFVEFVLGPVGVEVLERAGFERP